MHHGSRSLPRTLSPTRYNFHPLEREARRGAQHCCNALQRGSIGYFELGLITSSTSLRSEQKLRVNVLYCLQTTVLDVQKVHPMVHMHVQNFQSKPGRGQGHFRNWCSSRDRSKLRGRREATFRSKWPHCASNAKGRHAASGIALSPTATVSVSTGRAHGYEDAATMT